MGVIRLNVRFWERHLMSSSWVLGERNRNKCLVVVIMHINLFILK